jgi:hypothetical protein
MPTVEAAVIAYPMVEDITIAARDGYPLAATMVVPAGRPRAAVLINSATAVPRKIYRGFATYLSPNTALPPSPTTIAASPVRGRPRSPALPSACGIGRRSTLRRRSITPGGHGPTFRCWPSVTPSAARQSGSRPTTARFRARC